MNNIKKLLKSTNREDIELGLIYLMKDKRILKQIADIRSDLFFTLHGLNINFSKSVYFWYKGSRFFLFLKYCYKAQKQIKDHGDFFI